MRGRNKAARAATTAAAKTAEDRKNADAAAVAWLLNHRTGPDAVAAARQITSPR